MSSGNLGAPWPTFQPTPKKRHSRWMWWVCLGFGAFSCIGFIMVAAEVRTRRFVKAAVISVLLCAITLAAVAIWPPVDEVTPNTNPDANADLSTSIVGWVCVAVWAFLIIYGLVLNQDYKRFLRDQYDEDDRRMRSGGPQAPGFHPQPVPPRTAAPSYAPPPAPTYGTSSAPPVDVSRIEADRYFATQPAGNAPAAIPPNVPVT